MNNVLCIGELLIDMIGEASTGSLSSQVSFVKKSGGAPANVACVIGALGGKCVFFGAVGKDGFGDYLEGTLVSFSVDSSQLKRSEKSTTMAFVSVDEHGERDFVFMRGADADLSFDDLDASIRAHASIVHFGSATGFLEGHLETTYLQLLDRSYVEDKFISFDPNYRNAFWQAHIETFKEKVHVFMEKADLIKLSEEEAQIITGESSIEKAKSILTEKYDGTFAITLGKEGVLLFTKNWSVTVPAPKVHVLDTTGAGDAFVGALLYALSLSESAKLSVKNEAIMTAYAKEANRIAASVCTAMGALTALEK